MKIYATSDTHFGHDKLIEYGRPADFTKRIMDAFFPDTKNLRPLEGDLLIHCGDFCIGNDDKWHKEFMTQSCGFKKKILVRGNHDGKSDSWYYDHGWDFVCESFENDYFGKAILFSHIPLPESDTFGIDMNIHGHLHGNGQSSHRKIAGYDKDFHYDLAPEIHNYKPVDLSKIII